MKNQDSMKNQDVMKDRELLMAPRPAPLDAITAHEMPR
jgi:hypothetical protein